MDEKELLKQWLKDHRIRQADLARRMGVQRQYINNILTGAGTLTKGFRFELMQLYPELADIFLPARNGNQHVDPGCP